MKSYILSLACCAILNATSVLAAGPDNIVGTWTTENAKSQVEIFNCGSKLCAKIVSLKEPVYADPKDGPVGKPKVDLKNPDQGKRKQPIVGLQIMEGFTQSGEGAWANGTIYDPENGKTYKCKATLDGPSRLKVRGYIGVSLIGRTTVWTR